MEYLLFNPIYKERVWGGRNLESFLKRKLPSSSSIGESWEIVDRLEDQSTLAGGSFRGKSLRKVLEEHAGSIMGPDWPRDKPFPILVKWLDCRERLSIQVHPPQKMARSFGGEPKTENWYIAHASKDAYVIAGLKRGVNRKIFESALKSQALESCVHRIKVSLGDSIFIPSGRLHAIGEGNFILEIQQNSNTTYRVYDWGRVGFDGKPRNLNVDESLKSIDFKDYEPQKHPSNSKDAILVNCPHFRIRKITLLPNTPPLSFESGIQPRIISVVEGAVQIKPGHSNASDVLSFGSNVILPYKGNFSLESNQKSIILIADKFNGS